MSGENTGTLRTENAGQYLSTQFEGYLKQHGLRHGLSVSYTLQQNSIAEHMNRTPVESARTTLNPAELLKHYWKETVAIEVGPTHT